MPAIDHSERGQWVRTTGANSVGDLKSTSMNNLKTVGLLAFMTALLALVVYWMGGGFVWMIAVIVGFNLLAYFFSDK